MIGLIIFGILFFIGVGIFGLFLLYKGATGATATFRWRGASIDGPVGAVIAVASMLLVVGLVALYNPALEKENKRLTAENADLTSELQTTKKERDDLDNKLRAEKAHSDTLANQVRALTTDKEQAEEKLVSVQGGLTQAQQKVATQASQINDLSGKNDTLTKQLSNQTLQREEAQKQALLAWQTANEMGLSPAQQAEFKDIDAKVMDLNKDLTYLRIAPAYWPRIEGKKAVATYEIYQKAFEADQMRPRGAGLFDFNSEEYTIKGDYQGRLAQTIQTSISGLICEAARRAVTQHVPVSDAIRNMPPIREYDLDPQLRAILGEFQYVRMRLQIMAGYAVILVRGYADGEQTGWSRKLDPDFATVQLHENARPNAQPIDYALTFKPDLTQVAIGKDSSNGPTYTNTDLPNLRGDMAARIISALVDDCPQTVPNTSVGTIPVEVLEGQVYSQHSEVDRKARVYLLVFLKSPA